MSLYIRTTSNRCQCHWYIIVSLCKSLCRLLSVCSVNPYIICPNRYGHISLNNNYTVDIQVFDICKPLRICLIWHLKDSQHGTLGLVEVRFDNMYLYVPNRWSLFVFAYGFNRISVPPWFPTPRCCFYLTCWCYVFLQKLETKA